MFLLLVGGNVIMRPEKVSLESGNLPAQSSPLTIVPATVNVKAAPLFGSEAV